MPEAGAAGIRQGSEVYFLGTLVGSVSDVIVDTTGRMEAQANIRYDFFRFVRAGRDTVGKLLTDPETADELKTLLVNANRSVDELQVTLKNLQTASGNLQQASTNFPAISDAIRLEAKDLPGLVSQTQTSMRELERLIEAMQRHWLLRKYVNKTNPPPLHPLPESQAPETKPVKALRSPKDRM